MNFRPKQGQLHLVRQRLMGIAFLLFFLSFFIYDFLFIPMLLVYLGILIYNNFFFLDEEETFFRQFVYAKEEGKKVAQRFSLYWILSVVLIFSLLLGLLYFFNNPILFRIIRTITCYILLYPTLVLLLSLRMNQYKLSSKKGDIR